MRCDCNKPFRSMRFVMLFAAAIMNSLAFAAFYSASLRDYVIGWSYGMDSKDYSWTVVTYLSIHSFQVILWILVLLHFLGEAPNMRSKQLFSFLGVVFFFISGLYGMYTIYSYTKGVPWVGKATTPTYVFCSLFVAILLLMELYFGYREEGFQLEQAVSQIDSS